MKNNDKLPSTQDPRCGTTAGYHRHKNANEVYCQPCKNAAKIYRAIWYQKNQKKAIDYSSQWRSENPEIQQKQHADYLKKNPDVFRRAASRRRAKKLNNESKIYTEKQVLDLYGHNCHICNEPIDLKAARRAGMTNWEYGLQIDHVIPLTKGGSDNLDNVRPSHGICNLKKGNRSNICSN